MRSPPLTRSPSQSVRDARKDPHHLTQARSRQRPTRAWLTRRTSVRGGQDGLDHRKQVSRCEALAARTRTRTDSSLRRRRTWIIQGPRALGALGEIGSASTPDAIAAWTKATDGKVKVFDDGTRSSLGQAVDAGRVIGPSQRMATDIEAPPMYEPPPETAPATAEAVVADAAEATERESTSGVRAAVSEAVATNPSAPEPAHAAQSELDLEQGRANLARLRAALLEKQQAEDALQVSASQRPDDRDERDSSPPIHTGPSQEAHR